ncbi:MAG: hypothetical protein MJE77_41370 [Proteobacteria bacterium]|nr:hypothetical protein [Pseudomonadota bacterium]
MTGLIAGSTIVNLEASTQPLSAAWLFAESAHSGELPHLEHYDEESSAVDFFGHVLARAATGNWDKLDADRALLDTCARFARAGGKSGIQLGGLSDQLGTVTVRESDATVIERLRDQTPAPRSVRVTGTLDTISATSAEITLRVSQDITVRARLDAPNSELLRKLFNTRVVISGRAHFGSSGRLLFVAAEYVGAASEGDELWATVPSPDAGIKSLVIEPMLQTSEKGISAFLGIWPGDESDEELRNALEAIR